MFRAIKDEIKNGITKTIFHVIRFGGLLIIPFIYGFSYIFAFYDPFSNVNKVKMIVITDKNSFLGSEIGENISNTKNKIKLGDLDLTLKMNHIHSDNKNLENEKKDSFVYLRINDTNELENNIANIIADDSIIQDIVSTSKIIEELNNPTNQIVKLTLNNKKNYLLAFGIDAGSSMYSTTQFVLDSLLKTISSENNINHLSWQVLKKKKNIPYEKSLTAKEKDNYKNEFEIIKKDVNKKINRVVNANPFNKEQKPIQIEGHMSEHTKYGYGLAPFFISVAMWIGSMTLTFAIHRKIYDNSISPGMRYFAKWTLLVFGILLQATILMIPLYFIGFKFLGLNHWFMMYGGAIITGIFFVSIIQAIRFSVSGRTVSILLVIILLVLQMASAGGLFPIETQTSIYQFLNKILPMGKTVTIIRELSYETNWSNIMINFSMLSIWLFIVPIGVVANHYKTLRHYKNNNIPLPQGVKNTKLFENFRNWGNS